MDLLYWSQTRGIRIVTGRMSPCHVTPNMLPTMQLLHARHGERLWVLSEPWRQGTCTWTPKTAVVKNTPVRPSPTPSISTFSSGPTWKQSEPHGSDLELTNKCLSYEKAGWEKPQMWYPSCYKCSCREPLPVSLISLSTYTWRANSAFLQSKANKGGSAVSIGILTFLLSQMALPQHQSTATSA